MTSGARAVLRRIGHAAGKTALGCLAVALAWVALALHPQPLFAYTAERANVTLHARTPFPAETGPILDEVLRRISLSPLYNPARAQHVYLCDSRALFALFALRQYRSGGVTEMLLGRNAFIRPSSLERNVVFGPSGVPKQPERTLTYFIAHELTHAMTADRIGGVRSFRLAAFQREGYADYVAFARPVDFKRGRDAILRDAPEMSVQRSGLYARYELLTAYLLERRGLTVDEFLARPRSAKEVEAELLNDPTL
jgi:hypothetical protein